MASYLCLQLIVLCPMQLEYPSCFELEGNGQRTLEMFCILAPQGNGKATIP